MKKYCRALLISVIASTLFSVSLTKAKNAPSHRSQTQKKYALPIIASGISVALISAIAGGYWYLHKKKTNSLDQSLWPIKEVADQQSPIDVTNGHTHHPKTHVLSQSTWLIKETNDQTLPSGVYIWFDEQGRGHATAGLNTISFTYSINSKNNSVAIYDPSTTERGACSDKMVKAMKTEEKLGEILSGTFNYQLDKQTMRLVKENGSVLHLVQDK